jgi:hypothetical protein
MSSIAKGDAFEDRVYKAIKKELNGDRLGLSPKCAKIFKKRKYYSRDRDNDIICDISVEMWLPKADRWSLLWVCECKDYSRPIPVDDVEEFKSKLDQITGANRKGVLVISGAMQASALQYGRSNGIGVVRLLPSDQVQHVLFYTTAAMLRRRAFRVDPSEWQRALTQSNFVGKNRAFYSVYRQHLCGDWHTLLNKSLRR